MHAGPFDPSISEDSAARDYYDLLSPAPKTIISTKTGRCWSSLKSKVYGISVSVRQALLCDSGIWSARGKARICDDADGNITTCTSETVSGSSAGNTNIRLTAYQSVHEASIVSTYWSGVDGSHLRCNFMPALITPFEFDCRRRGSKHH